MGHSWTTRTFYNQNKQNLWTILPVNGTSGCVFVWDEIWSDISTLETIEVPFQAVGRNHICIFHIKFEEKKNVYRHTLGFLEDLAYQFYRKKQWSDWNMSSLVLKNRDLLPKQLHSKIKESISMEDTHKYKYMAAASWIQKSI